MKRKGHAGDSPGAPGGAPHRHVAVTFTGNVIAFIAAMAGGMITARVLGPAGRGTFALLHTTPDLIVSFVLLGIIQTNVCFVSNGMLPAGRALAVSARAALLQTLAGLAVFAVFVLGFRGQFFGDSSGRMILLAAALVPLGILQAHWSSIMSALRLFGRLAVIRALAPVLLAALYAILLVWLGLGVGGGIAAVVASTLIVTALMLLAIRQQRDPDGASGGDGGALCEGFWKRYLSYGIKLHASALVWYLIIRIDIYMIKSILDIESVGFYSLASSLAEKLWLVSASANTVLLPSLAAVADPVERARLAAKAARQLTVVLLPFFLLGAVLGRPLVVLLYGAEFEPATLPFIILLGSTLMQAHRSMTASFFESSNLALVNVATRIAAFALKVALNLLLIPALLMEGAALASLAAYSFEWLIGTGVFLRRTGLRWREAIPGPGDLAAVRTKTGDLLGAVLPWPRRPGA
ncbi:MAG: oligosaccharide flippase family protein [Candidatus Fermentibacter sp.]|nr:oligosaccharide flippase family protein [Candidatus Fermentibacter sp.]